MVLGESSGRGTGKLDLQGHSWWTARHLYSAYIYCAEDEGEKKFEDTMV